MTSTQGQRKWLGAFLISLSLVSGIGSGFFWHSYRSGEVVRPIERNVLFELLIDDKNCDSGISRDWFDGAYLINESKEKIQSLTNIFLDLNCSEDSEIMKVTFVVKPTISPVYRLVLFQNREKTMDDILTVTEVVTGDSTGIPSLLEVISADCAIGQHLCN